MILGVVLRMCARMERESRSWAALYYGHSRRFVIIAIVIMHSIGIYQPGWKSQIGPRPRLPMPMVYQRQVLKDLCLDLPPCNKK
jgi:hypothetical protein